jgi:hypothetical protein
MQNGIKYPNCALPKGEQYCGQYGIQQANLREK